MRVITGLLYSGLGQGFRQSAGSGFALAEFAIKSSVRTMAERIHPHPSLVERLVALGRRLRTLRRPSEAAELPFYLQDVRIFVVSAVLLVFFLYKIKKGGPETEPPYES